VAVTPLAVTAAVSPADAGTVTYVPWSSQLPGWTTEFIPSSSNDCVAGRRACVKATTKELARILQLTGTSCSHDAPFALAYTRMTQTFGWSRDIPGYYQDPAFATHQAAVFAKHYTDAFYNWRNGNNGAVPRAWQIAFTSAAGKKVSGTGDLMLGMNAHINRDLPFVVAAVGLTAPDGTSRKPDFDKVEEWLATASAPMAAENAQRFDPIMDDGDDPLGAAYSAVMQVVSVWRENAWRNAERLVSAPTPEARALVAADIEASANATAQSIQATYSYLPPVTTTTPRDGYCAVHNGDTAPMPYDFGTPAPYSP